MFNNYSLALDYHENSKSPPQSRIFDPKLNYKIYPNTKAIPLAKFDMQSGSNDDFVRTLLSRRSTREFSQENISIKELGILLSLSFGLRHNVNETEF